MHCHTMGVGLTFEGHSTNIATMTLNVVTCDVYSEYLKEGPEKRVSICVKVISELLRLSDSSRMQLST